MSMVSACATSVNGKEPQTLALKLDTARMRRRENPAATRPQLYVVPKVAAAIVEEPPEIEPTPGIFRRVLAAGNRAFAFTFIVVAFVGLCVGAYVAGWNDRIMTDARSEVEIILAAPLDPVQKPADWNQVTGQRR